MLKEKQREDNTGQQFENRLHIDCSTNNHLSQLQEADDLECWFMAILPRRQPPGPGTRRKLGSSFANGHSVISRERSFEGLLRASAQRSYPTPEDAKDKNPMMAPPGYETRPSGRVLELQNRDVWLRLTDMSWHLPILGTVLEEPSSNYRSRTAEKWKAKDQKLERLIRRGPKRMATKVQLLFWKRQRIFGCVSQDVEPPRSSSSSRKSSTMQKTIRCVRFTKAVLRKASDQDQNQSLDAICPRDPHQCSPSAPKFEGWTQEETGWQEHWAREAAWKLAKKILKLEEEQKTTFFSPT